MSTIKIKKKRKSAIEILFIISGVILPLVSFLIFYLYVNLDGLFMAFLEPTGTGTKFAGFENFKWVFEKIFYKGNYVNRDEDLKLCLLNTTKTFILRLIMFFSGVGVSYFIYKKIAGFKTFRVLFSLPMVLSSVVVSFFYLELMSSGSGFPAFLERLYHLDYHLKSPLTDSRFANKMIFLEIIWFNFPGNIIIWGGTFSRIPDSIIEAGKLDGVSWLKEIFVIILPLVWPTMVLMLTTVIASFFSSTGNVFLLTKGQYGTNTLSNWMYMQILLSNDPYRSRGLYYVSAMGVCCTVIACTVAILMRKFLVSRVEETQY